METQTERRDGMGKKERRRGEWNRAGRNERGVGGGESGRDGATKEMGKERHERTGADRPSEWGTLLFMESQPLDVFGGLRLGYPLLQGKEGKGSGETTPPWSPPHSLRRR